MQDFLVEGVRQMFGGQFFKGGKILLLGEPLKFLENFSKICIKIINHMQFYGENFRKSGNISRKLSFFCA